MTNDTKYYSLQSFLVIVLRDSEKVFKPVEQNKRHFGFKAYPYTLG